MSDKKHHIDQLFQTGLKGHKVSAPQNAWSRLQHDLQKPPRTAMFYYSRVAAAVVLLMLAFGAGYFLSEITKNDNPPVMVQNEQFAPEIVDRTPQTSDITESENIIDRGRTDENAANSTDEINQPGFSAKSQTEVAANATSKPGNLQPDDAIAAIENELPPQPMVVENLPSEKQIAENIAEEKPQELIAETNTKTQETPESGEEIQTPETMSPEMLQRLLLGPEESLQIAATDFTTDTKVSRWIIGGRVSPVYSYRSLDGEYFANPDETVDASFFDQNEEGITTIAGGISLDYQFNKRLSLGSGMFISRIGQQNNNVLAYNDPEFSNMYKLASSSGSVSVNPAKFENAIQKPVAITKDSVPGDYLINGSFVQNLDYLEIPFVLKYQVIESKISLQVMGGLSPGILVNNRSYFQLEGEKLQTGTTEDINPFIYNSIVGFGLSYSLSEKLSLNMEPSFKYSLSPVNSSTGINYHPYSFSWFTGISYRIY
jgi:hypothetical protein